VKIRDENSVHDRKSLNRRKMPAPLQRWSAAIDAGDSSFFEHEDEHEIFKSCSMWFRVYAARLGEGDRMNAGLRTGVAIGAPRADGVVDPATATKYAERARPRSARITSGRTDVVCARIPVPGPFPNISSHAMQAVTVCREVSHRACARL